MNGIMTSLEASVLDLLEQFPLKSASKKEGDTVWRLRALQLEGTIDSLKRKHAEELAGETILPFILTITELLNAIAELDIFRANACTEKSSNLTARNGIYKKRRKLDAAIAVASETEGASAATAPASITGGIRSLNTAGN